MTTTQPIEILDFGEDSDWLAASGHHDVGLFLDAADKHVREQWGESDAVLPSQTWDQPTHTFYRPVALEDCRKDIDSWHRGRSAIERLGMAEKLYESRAEEGWVYRCEADHPLAEPWTEVRV